HADVKALVAHYEVPELVLEDDGEFFRIFRAQPVGYLHAIGARVERNKEMMVAGQAARRHVGQNLAQHAAQRFLCEKIVTDQVHGHGDKYADSGVTYQWVRSLQGRRLRFRLMRESALRREMKWGLLLPGAPGPRLTVQPARAEVRYFKPLTRPEQPEHSCRWQL